MIPVTWTGVILNGNVLERDTIPQKCGSTLNEIKDNHFSFDHNRIIQDDMRQQITV